jgi:hypothetical protein
MIDKIEIEKGRNVLKEKLEKQREILMQTARSKDKAQNAIEELISLQKQIDVIPTLSQIEYGDAIDQIYENGATITLGEDFVHIHTSGHEVIVKVCNNPSANVYNYYKRCFDLHNQTIRTEDEETDYQGLLLYCSLIFQFPFLWWGDSETLLERFIENYDIYVELLRSSQEILQKANLIEDEKFKEGVVFAESLPNEIK